MNLLSILYLIILFGISLTVVTWYIAFMLILGAIFYIIEKLGIVDFNQNK